MLSDEEKRALSKVRLEQANDALREACSMLSADHYRGLATAPITRFFTRCAPF